MKTNEQNFTRKKELFPLLFISLLALCFMVAGCGKDDGISYVTDNELLNRNNITDVTHLFSWEKHEDEQDFCYGIRKGKDWFALFDNTGILWKEWYGKDRGNESFTISYGGTDWLKEFGVGEFLYIINYSIDDCKQLVRLTSNQSVEYGAELDSMTIARIVTENLFLASPLEKDNYNMYDFEGNIVANDVMFSNMSSYPYEIFIGFKDSKVWISYTDENKNWHEAIGLDPFERNRTVNLGYGEYKNFYVERIYTRRFIMTEWGFACIPYYNFDNKILPTDCVFLCNGNEIIYYPCEKDPAQLRNWYDGTVLIDNEEVVSPNGESLAYFASSVESATEPISLTDGINFCVPGYREVYRFNRKNYQSGETVWITEIPQLKDAQSDARITDTLLEKDGTIWKYHFEVVNKDGSRYDFYLNLNVETGEIN